MNSYKILIVDDQYEQIEQMVKIIEQNQEEYNILQALNAKDALKIANNEQPDIIISDWEMPVINGIEFIKLLKKNENTKEIPVIMCTGIMISSVNLKYALEAGFVDFIRKPIDAIEFLSRIKAMIRLYESNKKILEQKETIFQKEKIILEQELTFKKNEFSALHIRYQQDKSQIIKLLRNLSQIQRLNYNEVENEIQKLIKTIKEDTQKTSINEFEKHFESINIGFLQRLKSNFPKLTTNDVHLCGFFILNFSTKEIATIMNQNYETIRKSRSRLRKKLNISEETDLHAFLLTI
jgi:DNA-binding response OmpR family regulator